MSEHELTDAEKEVFRAASWRRKQAGIKLGRFCIMADAHQIHALNNFWDGFVERFGKQGAVDVVLVSFRRLEWETKELERKRAIQRPTTKD